MQLIKIISSAIVKGFRIPKFARYGRNDIQTADQASPYGVDASPIKDMVAVYSETSEKGRPVIVGYLNKNQLAKPGEHRTFSTDSDGVQKFYIWLRDDGTFEIGGTTHNLIRFSPTKEVIEEIQNDIKDLKQAFTIWVTVPNDGGAALKAAAATWAATPLVKDIEAAKIDEIKTL